MRNDHFFSGLAGRFCVLDVAIKDKVFHFIRVYGSNVWELPDFFQCMSVSGSIFCGITSNIPTFVDLKVNKIKSNPHVRCLLQSSACL